MKHLLLFCLLLSGCSGTQLIVNHPTIMIHSKGHDDVVSGVAVSVRVKWDIVEK